MGTPSRRVLVGALFVSLASPAAAAGPGQAEQLFQEGRDLMLSGQLEEGCSKIEESQRLDPHVGTLLNLAACHEKMGKTSTAWVEYQQALTAARAEGQQDRERFAQERIRVIEPRVSWVSVEVPADPPIRGLTVTLDGGHVLPMAWGKDMPVDPGEHIVAASAPDHERWETRFVLRESQSRTVTLPPLSPTNIEVVTKPAEPPEPAKKKPPNTSPAKPPTADEPSPWTFQLGVLAGYLGASGGWVDPDVSAGTIALRDPSGADTDCGYPERCSYTLDKGGGGLVAITGSVAYEIGDEIRLGARLLGGPRIGRGGGGVFALGPTLTVPIRDGVWAGLSALIGEAHVAGYGEVVPPAGSSQAGGGPYLMRSTVGQPAIGGGLEVGVRLLSLPHGDLDVAVLPMFLQGDKGSFWIVPIGVLYQL